MYTVIVPRPTAVAQHRCATCACTLAQSLVNSNKRDQREEIEIERTWCNAGLVLFAYLEVISLKLGSNGGNNPTRAPQSTPPCDLVGRVCAHVPCNSQPHAQPISSGGLRMCIEDGVGKHTSGMFARVSQLSS